MARDIQVSIPFDTKQQQLDPSELSSDELSEKTREEAARQLAEFEDAVRTVLENTPTAAYKDIDSGLLIPEFTAMVTGGDVDFYNEAYDLRLGVVIRNGGMRDDGQLTRVLRDNLDYDRVQTELNPETRL